MQRIDHNNLPGKYQRSPNLLSRGVISYKDGGNISDEQAPFLSAKFLSSLVECTPARKHLLEFNRRIICDGTIWQFVCAPHEMEPCYICPSTVPELTIALFEDPECKYIFEDLGLTVTV